MNTRTTYNSMFLDSMPIASKQKYHYHIKLVDPYMSLSVIQYQHIIRPQHLRSHHVFSRVRAHKLQFSVQSFAYHCLSCPFFFLVIALSVLRLKTFDHPFWISYFSLRRLYIYLYSHNPKYNGIEKYTNYIYKNKMNNK